MDENGIPCCPNDNSLPMKHEGTSTRKNGLKRYKFICPKIKYVKDASTGKYHRHCICDNLCLAGRRTQNEKTLHADLILAGITQLITDVLANKIKHHEYVRSLKPLIA